MILSTRRGKTNDRREEERKSRDLRVIAVIIYRVISNNILLFFFFLFLMGWLRSKLFNEKSRLKIESFNDRNLNGLSRKHIAPE
jgi:hypothetical protein